MSRIVLLVLLLVPILSISSTSKNIIIESNNELMILKKELDKEKDELKKIDQSKTSLVIKLRNIEKEIRLNENVLHEINRRYNLVKESRAEVIEKIDILNNDISKLIKEIKKGNIYFVDNRGVLNLKLLIFSNSYHEMIKNLEILEKANLNMKQKVNQIVEKKQAIDNLNKILVEKEKELEDLKKLKWDVIKELQNEKVLYQQTLAVLDADKRNKQSYLDILTSRYEDLNKRFLEVEKESKNQPQKPVSNGFAKLKGGLDWPVKGKIVEHYGVKYVEALKTEVFNKGIKIQVQGDGFVRSVYDGVVKYIDWIKGYGNLIIISHEDNYYTIYANIDDVMVQNGQKVKKGDKIGIIDVDIQDVQHYLYFEIRKNNNALNPEEWLKKEAA
ncbi:MAG: peptidoglycan DD-metalloendopeptidase family protein [Calditerrivibrio sp.]|nr:peptidoglycan DD-metalloendopeptidase family protein [Calditerrivibrio sp.]